VGPAWRYSSRLRADHLRGRAPADRPAACPHDASRLSCAGGRTCSDSCPRTRNRHARGSSRRHELDLPIEPSRREGGTGAPRCGTRWWAPVLGQERRRRRSQQPPRCRRVARLVKNLCGQRRFLSRDASLYATEPGWRQADLRQSLRRRPAGERKDGFCPGSAIRDSDTPGLGATRSAPPPD
jgi:hypothetical protein